MAELQEVIDTRRTIRKYTDKPISNETVDRLLKVIEGTQSWANTQCWEVVLVKSSEVREGLLATIPKKNPGLKALVNAPVVMVLCARRGVSGKIGEGDYATKHGDWYMYDLGIATQNICLAAHDLGLGTVVIGWFDHDAAEEVLKTPAGIEVVSIIPIGYRAHDGKAPNHKPVEKFLHVDSFGE